ncbi:MAG: class I SAM-dependent methyltransferase [Sporolactobacillus sp.]
MDEEMQIKRDFNEIASLDEEALWNHNNCYFPSLLKHIPRGARAALDIGCGKGELSALLAQRVQRVTAVDFADQMITCARARHAEANIDYINSNIMTIPFPDGAFDIIISTATAHHLPFDWLLDFAKNKLRAGGTLILLDLVQAETFADHLFWDSAVIVNLFMNLIKNGRFQQHDARAAALWQRHGERDHYLTLREVRAISARHLPGASVRRNLFWRYTLIWNKP